MPYELYCDNNSYKFDKLSDVPKNLYEKIISLEAFEMRIRDINNIGLKFPNLEELKWDILNIQWPDTSNVLK